MTLLSVSLVISVEELERMMYVENLRQSRIEEIQSRPLKFLQYLEEEGKVAKDDFSALVKLLRDTLFPCSYTTCARLIADYKQKKRFHRGQTSSSSDSESSAEGDNELVRKLGKKSVTRDRNETNDDEKHRPYSRNDSLRSDNSVRLTDSTDDLESDGCFVVESDGCRVVV